MSPLPLKVDVHLVSFFYLGRYFDGIGRTTYGSGTDGRPRVPAPGSDCP